MYKIGELSKLCNISVKTLRYYDAEGLLIPDEIDKFTGYRYYSASKLEDCYRIIALKELGFSLDEIREQLTSENNEKITAALDAKLDDLQVLMKTTQTQLRKIEAIKNNLTKGESKMFNPPRPLRLSSTRCRPTSSTRPTQTVSSWTRTVTC